MCWSFYMFLSPPPADVQLVGFPVLRGAVPEEYSVNSFLASYTMRAVIFL